MPPLASRKTMASTGLPGMSRGKKKLSTNASQKAPKNQASLPRKYRWNRDNLIRRSYPPVVDKLCKSQGLGSKGDAAPLNSHKPTAQAFAFSCETSFTPAPLCVGGDVGLSDVGNPDQTDWLNS